MELLTDKNKFKGLLLLWEKPMLAMALAFVIYVFFASLKGSIWGTSHHPYFNHLADAFLHGQFHLRLIPAFSDHDLVFFQNQYYLYWLPLPAVLLIPFVALFGAGFSDILFTLIVAAINVGLVAKLLCLGCQRGLFVLSDIQRALLVLFFAFGTVHMTMAPLGRVWFTSQLVGFCFTILAFIIPLRLKGWSAFLLTGFVVACASLTRLHLLFIGIWPAYYLIQKHRAEGFKKVSSYIAVGLLPLIMAGVIFFGYNWVRFGDILNVGLDYHKMSSRFTDDYWRYGFLNIRYVPRNLFYQYIAYPLFLGRNILMGGSLFLLSPLFFAIFSGIFRGKPRISVIFLVLTIIVVNFPILLLMGTGWVQFGPRYTLDFTIPLLFLTALGIRRWSVPLTSVLLGISVVHYIGGFFLLLILEL
jgi:hypothetical protein